MAKQYTFANYFNFTGGLNTDTSIFNTSPIECIDINNVSINDDGSISVRKGLEFVSGTPLETDATYRTLITTNKELNILPIYWNVYSLAGNLFKKIALIDREAVYIYPNLLTYPPDKKTYITSKSITEITQTVDYGSNTTSIDDKVVSTTTGKTITSSGIFSKYTASVDGNFLVVFSDAILPNVFYYNESDVFTNIALCPMIRENTPEEEKSVIKAAYTSKFPSVGIFAFGRAFYAGEQEKPNRILFSQVYDGNIETYEKCYQEKSPFDPDDPDVVATDGGELYITGANRIVGLLEYNESILVFAENGVWQIKSGTSGFSADDFSVSKITDIGCCSVRGYTQAENTAVFVSYNGVYILVPDDITGKLKIASLSENKINSFWNAISITNRENTSIFYNKETKQLYIMYNDIELGNSINCHYSNILIYNFKFKAWNKYSLQQDTDGSKYRINSLFFYPVVKEQLSLVDNTGNVIITTSGDLVSLYSYTSKTAFEPVLLMSKLVNDKQYNRFCYLNSTNKIDFKGDAEEEYYDAYILSSHQLYGDIARRKSNSYMYVALKNVDTGTTNELGIDINPQDVLYRVGFDFVSNPTYTVDKFGEFYLTNSKYGNYRKLIPSKLPTSYYNKDNVIIPIKLLGSGKALQFEFRNRIDTRSFKCLSNNVTTSPLVDTTNWEEIEYDSTHSSWDESLVYNKDDIVKVIVVYDFNIQGWATQLIPNSKPSGVI